MTIPNTVTNLGNSVFAGCSNLTSITIPDSIVSFGTNLFGNTPNVTVNASQSMIGYLAQNASALGLSGTALTSVQNESTAIGVFGWLKSWLPADSGFLGAVSTGLQLPSVHSSLSNSIGTLNGTISNQMIGLSNALTASASEITSLSNAVSTLAANSNFVASLANNPAFLNALAAQIVANSNLGIAVKLPQALAIAPISSITYSSKKATSVALKATSSANLTNTTFGIGNPSVGIINNNTTLIILGKGTTTITATNSGNGLYLPASASQPLIVK